MDVVHRACDGHPSRPPAVVVDLAWGPLTRHGAGGGNLQKPVSTTRATSTLAYSSLKPISFILWLRNGQNWPKGPYPNQTKPTQPIYWSSFCLTRSSILLVAWWNTLIARQPINKRPEALQPAVRVHAVAVTESAEAEMSSSALISAATSDLIAECELLISSFFPQRAVIFVTTLSMRLEGTEERAHISATSAATWLIIGFTGTCFSSVPRTAIFSTLSFMIRPTMYLAACRQLTRRQVTRHDTELSVWFV